MLSGVPVSYRDARPAVALMIFGFDPRRLWDRREAVTWGV
ncbi:hypothetical protein GCM10010468_57180 [Actinocorallia longicatena]|uniref:Uncharacterized protein n=1 Tax=Actinocorallia longicatena TaxID=111803 RepID=A0ABP6QI32_9ACTN